MHDCISLTISINWKKDSVIRFSEKKKLSDISLTWIYFCYTLLILSTPRIYEPLLVCISDMFLLLVCFLHGCMCVFLACPWVSWWRRMLRLCGEGWWSCLHYKSYSDKWVLYHSLSPLTFCEEFHECTSYMYQYLERGQTLDLF